MNIFGNYETENRNSAEIELSEKEAQQKLVEELKKPILPGVIPEIITCKSETSASYSNGESNFPFYRVFEPLMANTKILELFCGSNTAKEYLKRNNLPGEAIGVDNEAKESDIKIDVAKLSESLKPEGQFDIVTSFGAPPGIENYATDAAYLKDNGLYVSSMTEDWLDDKLKENILSWINGELDQIDDSEVIEVAKYFQIAAILKLNDVHLSSDWPGMEHTETVGNEYYFICKKIKQ